MVGVSRGPRSPKRAAPLAILALTLALPAGHARAQSTSVVPSEACIDGDPVQVLSFDELPLEDPRAAETAARAGILQSQSRAAIAVGFLAGTAASITGLTFTIVGATTDRPGMSRSGLTLLGSGLAVGFSGVFGGRALLRRSSELADEAIDREADATGRSVRWRSDEDPCENE